MKANDELTLYCERDASSEMDYRKWRVIYSLMKSDLVKRGDLGDQEARHQDVELGKRRYVWFDAIANELYKLNHR